MADSDAEREPWRITVWFYKHPRVGKAIQVAIILFGLLFCLYFLAVNCGTNGCPYG